jgi:peroxiredoxin
MRDSKSRGDWRLFVGIGLGISLVVVLAVVFLPNRTLHRAPSPEADSRSDSFSKVGVFAAKNKPKAHDFSLVELTSGKPVSIRDFRGKVIFLNFWATWCPPCKFEMPAMEKLYQAYRERGLEIFAVSQDLTGPEAPREFIREMGLTYPAAVDEGLQVSQLYGVRGLPYSVFIDREGRVIGAAHGAREWFGEEAKEFIEELLGEGEEVLNEG